MKQYTTNVQERQLEALTALKNLITTPNGLDIAVLQGGKIKLPGLVSGQENAENLDGIMGLSTAKAWELFDESGRVQQDKAAIAGIKFSPNDTLSNLNRVFTKEQINRLSDEEKVVIDALIYSLMGDLTRLELELATDSQSEEVLALKAENILKEAFSGVDLGLLLKDREQFIASVDKKIIEVTALKGKNVVVDFDDEALDAIKQMNARKSSPPNYEQVLAVINQQEIERSGQVQQVRARGLERFQKVIDELVRTVNSKDFLAGKVSQAELIVQAQKALALCQDRDGKSFQPEINTLKQLYSHVVTEALYQAVEDKTAKSVATVVKEVGLTTEVNSPGHTTVFNIIEHFERLSESVAQLDVHEDLHEPIHKASQLAAALLPVIDKNLKDRVAEAKAQLFLTSVKQEIVAKTVDKGWDTPRSGYNIIIDGIPYPVPKRVCKQYQAIENFQQGNASATAMADEVIRIGHEKSSSLFGPSEQTENYFANFKERYNHVKIKTEEESPQQVVENKPHF